MFLITTVRNILKVLTVEAGYLRLLQHLLISIVLILTHTPVQGKYRLPPHGGRFYEDRQIMLASHSGS